jgi:hypothetical protein
MLGLCLASDAGQGIAVGDDFVDQRRDLLVHLGLKRVTASLVVVCRGSVLQDVLRILLAHNFEVE